MRCTQQQYVPYQSHPTIGVHLVRLSRDHCTIHNNSTLEGCDNIGEEVSCYLFDFQYVTSYRVQLVTVSNPTSIPSPGDSASSEVMETDKIK